MPEQLLPVRSDSCANRFSPSALDGNLTCLTSLTPTISILGTIQDVTTTPSCVVAAQESFFIHSWNARVTAFRCIIGCLALFASDVPFRTPAPADTAVVFNSLSVLSAWISHLSIFHMCTSVVSCISLSRYLAFLGIVAFLIRFASCIDASKTGSLGYHEA